MKFVAPPGVHTQLTGRKLAPPVAALPQPQPLAQAAAAGSTTGTSQTGSGAADPALVLLRLKVRDTPRHVLSRLGAPHDSAARASSAAPKLTLYRPAASAGRLGFRILLRSSCLLCDG